MFDEPTSVSCRSASDKGWMYTVLKTQTAELMSAGCHCFDLSLHSGSYSFSELVQSCYLKSTQFIDKCATVYD